MIEPTARKGLAWPLMLMTMMAGARAATGKKLRWRPRQMVVPLTYTCTDSRNLPFTSFYVGVKVNAVGVKVKVAAQWLWGVKVNMGG